MCSWTSYKCQGNDVVPDGDQKWTFPSILNDDVFIRDICIGMSLLCAEKLDDLKYRDTP